MYLLFKELFLCEPTRFYLITLKIRLKICRTTNWICNSFSNEKKKLKGQVQNDDKKYDSLIEFPLIDINLDIATYLTNDLSPELNFEINISLSH